MPRLTLPLWIAHLRAIATPHAAPDACLALGALEPAFRRAVAADPPEPAAAPVDDAPEVALWRARTDGRVDVDAALGQAAPGAPGPLLEPGLYRAIEVWTDAELSALHALWWLARDRGRPEWTARVAAARDWHLVHTQPDNATNRPWALHVFALDPTEESAHYAETLLHNCLALSGYPTALAALILLDAARAIETAAGITGPATRR